MIEQLHFLRPEWFYAILPLALLAYLALNHTATSISWKKICDARLLPFILVSKPVRTSRLPLLATALATLLCIIAAAGPVWKKLPTPVFRDQSSLIIAVDLSRSMDASDIKPTRLERAKLKLLDILEQRKGGQTALLVYAAKAFTVTPLTSDTSTIANLISALETSMMPAQGSNVTDAIELSETLLTQAGETEGDILLITDGIKYHDFPAISNISDKGHRLSVLGVGTPDGGPIILDDGFLQDDKGNIVVPKLDIQSLQKAALTGGGLFVGMQNNDDDIKKLTDLFTRDRAETESTETELTADIWHEEGPWLLLFALPLVALLSRRGLLIVFAAIMIPIPEPVHAADMDKLWLNDSQRAMKHFEKGEHEDAATLFESDEWKASAYYKNGDYEKTIELLENEHVKKDSDTLYNKANALARLQRYEEAIEAYDEALKLNPENEDANYNRELVKKKLEEQQQQDKNDKKENKQEEEKDKQDADEKDKQDKKDEQKPSDKEGEQSEDEKSQDGYDADKESEDDKKDKASDKSGDEQNNEDKQESKPEPEDKKEEKAKEDQDSEAQNLQQKEAVEDSEDQKATEQWLKRIPDDPGGLLRRKFRYQYQKMPDQKPSAQPW